MKFIIKQLYEVLWQTFLKVITVITPRHYFDIGYTVIDRGIYFRRLYILRAEDMNISKSFHIKISIYVLLQCRWCGCMMFKITV